MSPGNTETKNDHSLNLFVSYELKHSLKKLATQCDRTVSDIVRLLLKIGIPIVEGMCRSEDILIKEQIELFRRTKCDREDHHSPGTLVQGGGPFV